MAADTSAPPSTPRPGPGEGLVIVHVPKAAGTALERSLEAVYGRRPARIAQPDAPAGAEVVIGHVPFGDPFAGSRRPIFVTVLRRPIERVRSWLRFVRTQPDHRLHRRLVGGETPDDLRRGGCLELDSFQTRLLAGRPVTGKPIGTLGDDDVGLAWANLRRCAAVGLQHRMDESMRSIASALRWPDGWRLGTHNASGAADTDHPADAGIHDDLVGAHRFDARLVEAVERCFGEPPASWPERIEDAAPRLAR